MSMEYLEELEKKVEIGTEFYATAGMGMNEWHVVEDLDQAIGRAKMVANSKQIDAPVYKLTSPMDMSSKLVFFVVRKLMEPLPNGKPNIHWFIVESKDGAEMLRDVSQGPSPYFGAITIKKVKPEVEVSEAL